MKLDYRTGYMCAEDLSYTPLVGKNVLNIFKVVLKEYFLVLLNILDTFKYYSKLS